MTTVDCQKMAERAHEAPPCALISIPKSGTHLGIKLLRTLGFRQAPISLTKLSRQFLAAPSDNSRKEPTIILHVGLNCGVPVSRVQSNLDNLSNGTLTFGHPMCSRQLHGMLQARGIRVIALIRDPRAIARSMVDWWTDERVAHPLRPYVVTRTMAERLDLVLGGAPLPPNSDIVGIAERFQRFLPWRDQDGVVTIQYEELVGSQGGASDIAQHSTIRRVANHLGLALDDGKVDWVSKNLFGDTNTFRFGQVERWREDFEPRHIRLVKDTLGDVLISQGYEHDHDWSPNAVATKPAAAR